MNASSHSLCDEPFDDLRADTAMASIRAPLTRTCELRSTNVTTFDTVPDDSSTVARVFARKKPTRGEEVRGTDANVLLSLQNISSLFHLPLGQAAEQLGICRTALKNACRKCGIARWPFHAPGGRVRREPTVSPSSPDIAVSTPHSHKKFSSAGSSSSGHSLAAATVHAPAASHSPPAPTQSTSDELAPSPDDHSQVPLSDVGPRSPLEEVLQGGFLFSSAGSYLSAELPAHALSYTPAAAWDVPPAQDGWRLPPPAATSDAWGACCSTSRSVEAFVGGNRSTVAVAQSEFPQLPAGAEDRGCDLSFLCFGLNAVTCSQVDSQGDRPG